MNTHSITITSSSILFATAVVLGGCDQEPSSSNLGGRDLASADEPGASGRAVQSDAFESGAHLEPRAAAADRLPGFALDLALSQGDVLLAWEDVGAAEYEVWLGDSAYFEPGGFGSELLGVTSYTSGTHFTGNTREGLSFYVVQAAGDPALRSTTVGRWARTAEVGFNKLPLVFSSPPQDASDIYGPLQDYVDVVYQFLPLSKAWQSWSPESTEEPFAVRHEMPLVIEVPEAFTMWNGGHVPPIGSLELSLKPGDNVVYLPLHYPPLRASELLEIVPDATQVGRWNAATQEIAWYDGEEQTEDVSFEPGDGLHLWMGEAGSWPVSAIDAFGACCDSNGSARCEDAIVTQCVCDSDAYCCNVTWDSICANEVSSLGCGSCG